ncbi:MAG: hypothetical protein ACYDEG_09050, partial [bacterium]
MFSIENCIEENKEIINNFLYEYFQKNYNDNYDNLLKKNISNEIS